MAALCEVKLGETPLDGTLFVFRNRRGTACKMLIWTYGGFTLLYKKLEKGRFRWPEMSTDRRGITSAELAALLEGIDLSRCRRLGRWNPKTGVESVRNTG